MESLRLTHIPGAWYVINEDRGDVADHVLFRFFISSIRLEMWENSIFQDIFRADFRRREW